MTFSSLAVVVIAALMAEKHDELNPVYASLYNSGVSLNESVKVTLPPPTMADGLDAAAQQNIIRTLTGSESTYRQFMRNSVVTKHILHMDEIEQDRAPARRADVWFVAYGDLDILANQEFLESLVAANEDEDNRLHGEGHQLTAEELAERGIELVPAEPDREQYGYGAYRLMKRVEVHGTIRTFWSRTDESILFAGELDPRFSSDDEFLNHWRPLDRNETGELVAGGPQPYGGMGMYMKITQLKEPKGALFVEGHLVFSEPYDWFDGANLLGSKLPAIIQNQVRSARREIVRASREP